MNSTLLFIGAGGLMTMVVLLSLFHLAPRALGTTQFEMVEN